MNWTDIAGRVAAAGAPMLGQMLGSMLPIPGGGALGEWAGRQIAEAFGVEATPAAIDAAIKAAPADVLASRLAVAEREASAKWAAIADIARAQAELGKAQVEAINDSIKHEVAKGDGLLGKWRGVHAWELTAECPVIMGALLFSIVTGNTVAINAFAGLSGLIMTYLGARFGVLGVHVWQGSNERQVAIAGAVPELLKPLARTASRR
jgi:hypothetical protein